MEKSIDNCSHLKEDELEFINTYRNLPEEIKPIVLELLCNKTLSYYSESQ